MDNFNNNMQNTECMETAHANHAGRKRKILFFALIVCCVAILAAGTLAYFTVEETAYNVITTGKLDMTLHEETTGGKPFPEDGIHGVMPGQTVDKKVYVENTGSADFYVRIALEKRIFDSDGGDSLSFKHITIDINTEDWTEKDGYYYYNKVLKPNEKTKPLFTTVTFEKDMGNRYMDARVEIDVDAQAVQSKNNGDSALTASGWAQAE